jgi:dienelactone hydrolase
VVQGQEDVCFALSLPKSEPPAAGYPLVVYAHGTGGSFTHGIRDLATTAAAAGASVLSIDMPVHGSRAHGAARGPDELFFNFTNPEAARDNVTQGSADLFALAHFARTLDADAASAFGQAVKFDGTRMVWFGHSQGATHVSLAAPFEPELAGVVLSGVGGDLSEGLVSKRSPIDLAGTLHVILADTSAGPEGELCPPAVSRTTGKPLTDSDGNPVYRCIGTNHPVYGLLQAYFDRVDPVNFGALWAKPPTGVKPKHVFMTFGVGDTFAPDGTQKAYAGASDLTLVAPELVPVPGQDEPAAAPLSANVKVGEVSVTQGLRQYPAEADKDAHFVYLRDDASADWQRFVTALLSGEAPAIGQ